MRSASKSLRVRDRLERRWGTRKPSCGRRSFSRDDDIRNLTRLPWRVSLLGPEGKIREPYHLDTKVRPGACLLEGKPLAPSPATRFWARATCGPGHNATYGLTPRPASPRGPLSAWGGSERSAPAPAGWNAPRDLSGTASVWARKGADLEPQSFAGTESGSIWRCPISRARPGHHGRGRHDPIRRAPST